MNLVNCFSQSKPILMEGALGERLKREYHLNIDQDVGMASLVYTSYGRKALLSLWNEYINIAKQYQLPFIATTPTRRANQQRVMTSNYTESIMKDNIDLLQTLKMKNDITMYIGGLMGCKGDAYKSTNSLSIHEAKEFHYWQASLFQQAGADFLFAGIMPAISEAIGMAQAMEMTGLEYIISFMIRDTGTLIDGTTIHNAIHLIDNSVMKKPLCYMTNCVHPNTLFKALSKNFNNTPLVRERFLGIQANTSPLTPEELDDSTDLKSSDSKLLAQEIMNLYELINIKICGGCCGTNQTHIEEIAKCLNDRNNYHTVHNQ